MQRGGGPNNHDNCGHSKPPVVTFNGPVKTLGGPSPLTFMTPESVEYVKGPQIRRKKMDFTKLLMQT